MATDSRQHPRAHLPAVRVRYARASGESTEGDAIDIGPGGLFVKTDAPLPPGKRLDIEIHVGGDPRPIGVLARVIWTRALPVDEERPAGMGLKFVDIEDDARDRIGALVTTRERTIQGIGGAAPRAVLAPAPERDTGIERDTVADDPNARGNTLTGVGEPPIGGSREASLLGVDDRGRTIRGVGGDGSAHAADDERSIPLGLVTKKPVADATEERAEERSSFSDDTQPSRLRAASLVAEQERRGRGVRWTLVILVLAGGAAFVFRDRVSAFVRAKIQPESPPVTTTTAPPPPAPPPPAPSAGPPDARAAEMATAEASAVASSTPPIADASTRDAGATDRDGSAKSADADASSAHAAPTGSAKKATPAAPKPKPKPKPPEEENPY